MKRIGLALIALLMWGVAQANPDVLEMTGQAEGARPDILYIAPKLTQPPKAYSKFLASMAKFGTTLPHAYLTESAFCSMGPLPVLSAAGYRILPIRDVTWEEATERLIEIFTLRQRSRYEDGIKQAPLCVTKLKQASRSQSSANSTPLATRIR